MYVLASWRKFLSPSSGCKSKSSVKVKVMLRPTVSRLLCLGVNPHLGFKTFCSLAVADYLMWNALPDERTGLSFTVYNVQYIYILHVITYVYT
jgi:hypothetical protein